MPEPFWLHTPVFDCNEAAPLASINPRAAEAPRSVFITGLSFYVFNRAAF